ncbi:WXG100 family type VII secretion target [Streptomyces hoynatensis]|uniref:WXG100 family type VII secretion target n=1 Tax=Streptomyces hoynatensis TaxID=1141874 RepID=A0A3A9Z3C0_9ACTN|nr:WXG100 family type VII secretion target [Streptomyces hoynatensis]RKN42951.1 WXG100 family type VII secretion target [Streptomyces hoynatensis]
MAGRPADWSPLTEDGRDPIPGDWELVREAAARYRRTADAIERAKTLLGNVTNASNGWRGESGDAFREKATELSDNVFKAWGRYDATANALAGYWPTFEEAQEQSLDLRTQALSVQDDIQVYTHRVHSIDTEGGTDEENEQAQSDLDEAQGHLNDAQARLNGLRNQLHNLITMKDDAADAAANAIGDFIGDDGLKDGWSDRFKTFFDGLKNILIAIGEWASKIAAIAGVLALLVGWIPVIGQALAAVLGTIALIASCFSLLGNILKGDWLGAALDLVGIVTFGIGRAVTPALRAAGQSSRFAAFRSLRGMMQFGNRAARTARAEGIIGSTAGRLHGANVIASRFSNPSGIMGWGRAAFGPRGIASEFGEGMRTIFSGSAWRQAGVEGLAGLRNIPNAFRTAGVGGALHAGAHSVFANPGAAADALSLGRAAQNGAQISGFAGASGAFLGAGGAGAASGLGGLIFKDGVGSLVDWNGISLGGDNPLPGDAAGVGDFTYRPEEAAVQ